MPSSNFLEIIDNAALSDIALLEACIDDFNADITGIADARRLSIFLRYDNGDLYAGLHGHTWGGTCHIKLLWIAEAHRGLGLGRQLLKAAEDEARRRRCRQIMLSTHSFQAPGFYARYGFMPIATVIDNPAGHFDIFMLKQLAD